MTYKKLKQQINAIPIPKGDFGEGVRQTKNLVLKIINDIEGEKNATTT